MAANQTSTNHLVLKIDGDGKGAVETLRAINAAVLTTGQNIQKLAQGKTALAAVVAVSPATLSAQKNNIALLVAEERGRAALAKTAAQEGNARAAAARAVTQENAARAAAARAALAETRAKTVATQATDKNAASADRAAKKIEASANRASAMQKRTADRNLAIQEAANRRAIELEENRYRIGYQQSQISASQYKAYLDKRLTQDEAYTAKWVSLAKERAKIATPPPVQTNTGAMRASLSAGGLSGSVASGLVTGNIAMAAGVAAIGTVKTALELAGNTEEALNVLAAQSHATDAQMAALAATARELGADITLPATSSVDAARAMLELSKGGLSVDNTMKAARGSLQLAAVATIDQADAAKITANALNVFELAGEDATRVTDLLTAASINSGKTIPEIADALRAVGSTAHAAKIPIEDVLTSIAILGKAGQTGETGGNALKNAILQLQNPTKKAAAELKSLGVEIFNADGSSRSLRDIINDLSRALANKTDKDRAHAMGMLFSSRAIQAGNILLSKGTGLYDEMSSKVTKAGEAARIAGAQQKGLNGALDGFHSTLDSILEKRAAPLLDFFSGIVRDGGKAAEVVDRLADRLDRLANPNNGGGGGGGEWDPFQAGVASGKWVRHQIGNIGRSLDAADAADKDRATPRYKAEHARGTLADISAVESKEGTPNYYLPRELGDKLRGYGVNVDRTDLAGKPDVGGILRMARPILEAAAKANSEQDNQSRLMAASGAVIKPKPKPKPKPKHDPGDDKDVDAAAKALAAANTEHIQILLSRVLKSYEKSGNPGDRARVVALASALREKKYAETDADAKTVEAKVPLLAKTKRQVGREHANDEYNDLVNGRLGEIAKGFSDKASKAAKQSASESAKGAAETAKKSFESVLELYKQTAYLPEEKRAGVLSRLNNRRRSYLNAEAHAKAAADAVDGDSKGKKSERIAAVGVLATDTTQKITEATQKITEEIAGAKDRYTSQVDKNDELLAEMGRKRLDAQIGLLRLDLDEAHDLQTRQTLRAQLLNLENSRILAEKTGADAKVNSEEAAAKAKSKNKTLTPEQTQEYTLRRSGNAETADNAINAAADASMRGGKADVREDAARQAANYRQRADAAQNLTEKLGLLSLAQAQERQAAGPLSTSEMDTLLARQAEESTALVIEILRQRANAALLRAAATGTRADLDAAFAAFNMARARATGPDGLAKAQKYEVGALTSAANVPNSKLPGHELAPLIKDRIAGIGADATARGEGALAVEAETAGDKFSHKVREGAREFAREMESSLHTIGSNLATAFFRGQLNRGGDRKNALKQAGGELWSRTTDLAGKSVSEELGRGVTREWKRAVANDIQPALKSVGDHLKKSLGDGGTSAGKAIGQAAMILYAAYNLSGKAGKKKQRNTAIGAALGFAAGSILPGVGNLEGAEIGATLGGMFAKGGRYPVGRDILVGERGPEIVKFDRAGTVIPNHKVGDYLDLSALMPLMGANGGLPTAAPRLSPSVAKALQSVQTGGAAGGYGDVRQDITIFGGVHGDRAVGRAGKAWGGELSDAVKMMGG